MSCARVALFSVIAFFAAYPTQAQNAEKVLPPPAPISLPDLMEQDVTEHPHVVAEPVTPTAPTQPVLPQKPKLGMHHVKVRDGSAPAKTQAPEQQQKADTKAQAQTPETNTPKTQAKIPNSASPEKENQRNTITPEQPDYFTPIDQTKIWPHTASLISTRNAAQLKLTLEKAEQDLAELPPTALVLAANAHTQQGNLKRAAELYYLAQLRAQVDAQRWPKATGRKTAQAELSALLDAYGPAITHWAMADSKRFARVIRDVMTLDAATAYRYHPGFEAGPAPDLSVWRSAHKRGRAVFEAETRKIIEALQTLKR